MIRLLCIFALLVPLAPIATADLQPVGPTISVRAIVADSGAATKAADDLGDAAPEAPSRTPWYCAIGGLVLVLLRKKAMAIAELIPGVPGLVARLAAGIADRGWEMFATPEQRDQEAKAEIALREAVAFGHAAFEQLAVTSPEIAQHLLQRAKTAQKALGVRDLISPVLETVRAGASPLTSISTTRPQG